MKELNVNPKMYGVTVGGDLPEFYDTLKQTRSTSTAPRSGSRCCPIPGNKEFFEAYKAEFKHEPSYHSAAGYAGCLIYAEGVKRANTLDADKVREALLKLEMRTMFGDYKVDPDGFQLAHKMVTFQWQKEKKVVVWPDELAQGKVRVPDAALDRSLTVRRCRGPPSARERRHHAGHARAGGHLRASCPGRCTPWWRSGWP